MSKIEWCDKASVFQGTQCKGHSVIESWMSFISFFIKPIGNILASLGAIAGYAGGHNISRICLSTILDGNNVIPRACLFAAIGTLPHEVFRQNFSPLGRHRFNVATVGRRTLPPTISEIFIAGISFSGLSIMTLLTGAPANILKRQPRLTAAAPGQAISLFCFPLAFSWSCSRWNIITVATYTLKIVATASISIKFRNWLPVFSPSTPFKSSLALVKIFFQWNVNTLSRYFQNALLTTHRFCPFFFALSVHSILPRRGGIVKCQPT